jgi:hypothetical protein
VHSLRVDTGQGRKSSNFFAKSFFGGSQAMSIQANNPGDKPKVSIEPPFGKPFTLDQLNQPITLDHQSTLKLFVSISSRNRRKSPLRKVAILAGSRRALLKSKALFYRSRVYLSRGDYASAVEAFSELVAARCELLRARLMLGEAHALLGDSTACVEDLNTYLIATVSNTGGVAAAAAARGHLLRGFVPDLPPGPARQIARQAGDELQTRNTPRRSIRGGLFRFGSSHGKGHRARRCHCSMHTIDRVDRRTTGGNASARMRVPAAHADR